jgi:hypothetical protein
LLPLHLYRSVNGDAASGQAAKIDGRQSADGSLTLSIPNGGRGLAAGDSFTWRFEAQRGEVSVELDARGEAEVKLEIGGQTLRGRLAGDQLNLGRAAIVVGGPTSLTVRIESGKAMVRSVRLKGATGNSE